LSFDAAVVTVPLGCLKKNTPSIHPALSPRLTRAISNISYGCLEKVYIAFPTAFWESPNSAQAAADSYAPNGSQAPISPFFTHFLCPRTPNYPSSTLECATLSSLHPSHPILLFYMYPPLSTYITLLITHLSPSSPIYYSLLNDFFQPYYSLLPNYSPTDPNCVPKAVVATDWQHDELAGWGSYTNFQTSNLLGEGEEEVELDQDIEVLREGCPERGIWFAGEHTAPFVALGTVTVSF
jgi:hypothetical protein